LVLNALSRMNDWFDGGRDRIRILHYTLLASADTLYGVHVTAVAFVSGARIWVGVDLCVDVMVNWRVIGGLRVGMIEGERAV
jgi:hypothetical protein